jgi:hypothetical protein
MKNNKKYIKFKPETKYAEDTMDEPNAAIKHIPEWYKKIPKYIGGQVDLKFPIGKESPNVTIKRCIPFLDAMTSGYMAYLAEDVFVDINEDGSPLLRWRTDREIISEHDVEQFDKLHIPKEYHRVVAKWSNHFGITLPKGYSMLFSHPNNRLDLPFFTFSGIVDCDNYNNPVQFPFILKKDFKGIIEAGTPICQMIPIKRDLWKSEKYKFDMVDSYKRTTKFLSTFIGSYKKNYWSKKSYE